jgi:1-aminocyclopropane-1-carboxylate deaminase/D-cysteine desulfhydrase-like pyridoxal-dependent ACC family enzyme
MIARDAFDRLDALPRRELAFTPTPLLPAHNLRAELGPDSPSILLKMDGWTGLGLGGNKIRKLEYVLAPEQLEGVDTLITSGGPQSNSCRAAAAAAARLGLKCILVVNGTPPDPPTGNALLHLLFGAEIRSVETREERAPAMEEAAREVEAAGGKAVIVPLGASTPLGALGYVRAAREIHQQLMAAGGWPPDRTWLFVSASSCGTLAGLVLGFSLLGLDNVRLVGVSADVSAREMMEVTDALVAGAGELVGWRGRVPEGLYLPDVDRIGAGYGIPTDTSDEATRLFARMEGVVLDPVYTGKVAAGMVAWIREGRIPADDTVVFWHTGGHPALLA